MDVLVLWEPRAEVLFERPRRRVEMKNCSIVKDSPVEYSVSRDIPVQSIQSAGIFQCAVFSQQGYSSV
jgi:hypothetical protein